jgi:hypothetical protein
VVPRVGRSFRSPARNQFVPEAAESLAPSAPPAWRWRIPNRRTGPRTGNVRLGPGRRFARSRRRAPTHAICPASRPLVSLQACASRRVKTYVFQDDGGLWTHTGPDNRSVGRTCGHRCARRRHPRELHPQRGPAPSRTYALLPNWRKAVGRAGVSAVSLDQAADASDRRVVGADAVTRRDHLPQTGALSSATNCCIAPGHHFRNGGQDSKYTAWRPKAGSPPTPSSSISR